MLGVVVDTRLRCKEHIARAAFERARDSDRAVRICSCVRSGVKQQIQVASRTDSFQPSSDQMPWYIQPTSMISITARSPSRNQQRQPYNLPMHKNNYTASHHAKTRAIAIKPRSPFLPRPLPPSPPQRTASTSTRPHHPV